MVFLIISQNEANIIFPSEYVKELSFLLPLNDVETWLKAAFESAIT